MQIRSERYIHISSAQKFKIYQRIFIEGAAILSDGIMLTQSLKELDLSSNDLGTEGINSLSNAFKDNSTIKRLTLAHNNLDFNSAPAIASILKENVVLEELNLAWNNLGTPLGNSFYITTRKTFLFLFFKLVNISIFSDENDI